MVAELKSQSDGEAVVSVRGLLAGRMAVKFVS